MAAAEGNVKRRVRSGSPVTVKNMKHIENSKLGWKFTDIFGSLKPTAIVRANKDESIKRWQSEDACLKDGISLHNGFENSNSSTGHGPLDAAKRSASIQGAIDVDSEQTNAQSKLYSGTKFHSCSSLTSHNMPCQININKMAKNPDKSNDGIDCASEELIDEVPGHDFREMVDEIPLHDSKGAIDENQSDTKQYIDDSHRLYLRRLSNNLFGGSEDLTEVCPMNISNGGVLEYLKTINEDTKTHIAHYLSSGNLKYVKLSADNIHDFYHVASLLSLKQLKDYCTSYCSKQSQSEILSHFTGCKCKTEMEREAASGYQRSCSVSSGTDPEDTPQYYIVFSGTKKLTKPATEDKHKVTVKVISMSEKSEVYNREVDKLRIFGNGFQCCSSEIEETPFVFVCGGEGKSSDVLLKYDVLLGRWEKCSKLIHGRSFHMMTYSEPDSIFALAGRETACIEEYSIKNNKWKERAHLKSPVISAVCCMYNDSLYLFGGKTVAGSIATVQCYDVKSHALRQCADMPCSFDGGHAVVVKDRIYVASNQCHLICFTPGSDVSHLCSHLPVQVHHFGMFYKNQRIYVVGGIPVNDKEDKGSTSQYRYNPDKDRWIEKNRYFPNFPVYASCIISYPKKCSVIPFNESS